MFSLFALNTNLDAIALVLTVFGVQDAYKWLLALRDWQVILIAVFTPLLYVIGIILDRVSDKLLHGWSGRIRSKAVADLAIPPTVMRFSLDPKNEFLNQQIEYTRSRMRIVRASTFNFALMAVFGVTFILSVAPEPLWLYISFVSILGSLMVVGALYTWRSLVISQLKIVKTNYDLQHSAASK